MVVCHPGITARGEVHADDGVYGKNQRRGEAGQQHVHGFVATAKYEPIHSSPG